MNSLISITGESEETLDNILLLIRLKTLMALRREGNRNGRFNDKIMDTVPCTVA